YLNMNNLIQVERGCMICSINIWLRAVAVHFSTPLRLYQPYACATDTDGEGQKNGQKLTHQSGEEPLFIHNWQPHTLSTATTALKILQTACFLLRSSSSPSCTNLRKQH
ncbi:hypothetical protein, partial [Thiolapillus sp.]|uniref:hypothetical protein n=1 Tax=Thiolapillus sp. TaxID=2017437 RepID=UPI003AF67E84